MEFRADTEIDQVNQGFTIVLTHVILVIKAPDLAARYTLRQHLVPYVHRVVHPWDKLECVKHGEKIHLKTQADELDDRIALGLDLEIAYFSGM